MIRQKNAETRNMIQIKTERELDLMRAAGKIAAEARNMVEKLVVVGATTRSINKAVHEYLISQGAVPTFLGYRDYPASICISVNEEVIHGIPSSRKLQHGDIVSIDVGATKKGYIGDCAATFIAGKGSEESEKLVRVTRECFYESLKYAIAGNRISDISRAIEQHAKINGFTVVQAFTGHGVGRKLHEPPEVPNFIAKPRKGPDPRLIPGMTLAVEPMVNAGGPDIEILEDGWTVVTTDGKSSAHYENTILITEGEPEILTVCEGMS